MLWDEHRIACVRLDYGEFNELSSCPDVTDFLLSVVGGFALEARRSGLLPNGWEKASIGSRMLDILRRLKMPDVELSVASTATITVQDLLSLDESFRARVRTHMRGRVSELVEEVRRFAGEVASGITTHSDGCAGFNCCTSWLGVRDGRRACRWRPRSSDRPSTRSERTTSP